MIIALLVGLDAIWNSIAGAVEMRWWLLTVLLLALGFSFIAWGIVFFRHGGTADSTMAASTAMVALLLTLMGSVFFAVGLGWGLLLTGVLAATGTAEFGRYWWQRMRTINHRSQE